MRRSSFLTATASSSSRVQTDKHERRLTLSSLEREHVELSDDAAEDSSPALHESSISIKAGTLLEVPCPKIGKSDHEKVKSADDSALPHG